MDNFVPDQYRDESYTVTLAAYEHETSVFLENAPSVVSDSLQLQLDRALRYLGPGSEILEVGSGSGRDADYLEERGYNVVRTDVSRNLVRYGRSRGKQVSCYDVLSGPLNRIFDAVFATAVFHHFNDAEFDKAAKHVLKMLKPYGVFVVCGYTGVGAHFKPFGERSHRFFRYRTPELMARQLERVGFIVEEQYLNDSWANCIASRP